MKLFTCQSKVQWQPGSTNPVYGKGNLQVFTAVVEKNRNVIAFAQPEVHQALGQAADPFLKLTIGIAFSQTDETFLVWVFFCVLF